MVRLLPLLVLLACGAADDAATDEVADTGTAETGELPDTWGSFASGFMETYCVACHDGGDKDFRVLADVVAWTEEIRCGTASSTQDGCGSWPPAGQFPIGDGAMPSDAERDRLTAWIDAGLPE